MGVGVLRTIRGWQLIKVSAFRTMTFRFFHFFESLHGEKKKKNLNFSPEKFCISRGRKFNGTNYFYIYDLLSRGDLFIHVRE